MSKVVLRNVDDGTFRTVEGDSQEFYRVIALKSTADAKKPRYEQTSYEAAGLVHPDEVETLYLDLPASAAGADTTKIVGESPVAGRVVAVKYIPATVLTGANTESRTLSAANKGQDGTGTTAVASTAFTSGVNAPAADTKLLTLNATAANLLVAAGDVLQFASTHVGATGLADPGGKVQIDISPGQN